MAGEHLGSARVDDDGAAVSGRLAASRLGRAARHVAGRRSVRRSLHAGLSRLPPRRDHDDHSRPRGALTVIAPALLAFALMGGVPAESSEVIAAIRVHGNLITPEDEILRIADVHVGMSFEPTTPEQITARLKAAKRFQSVEVLKRFAS